MVKNNKLKALFINIVIVFSLFVISEFLVRYLYSEIQLPGTSKNILKDNMYFNSPGLRPNSSGLSNGVVKSVDGKGFWKYSSVKKESSKKVLFLGDSVTMGIGVESDSTFAGIINNTASNISILNSSLIGYSIKDYRNIIEEKFVSYNNIDSITSVYIFWCLNDIYSNYSSKDIPGFNSDGLFSNLVAILRNNSKLFHLLKKIFADRAKAYYLFDKQFYNIKNYDFNSAVNSLIEIKKILNTNKIDVVIFLLPYEYQFRSVEEDDNPQNLLSCKLEELEFDVYNFRNDFSKLRKPLSDYYLYGDGIHFSKKGHRLIASILKETKYFDDF